MPGDSNWAQVPQTTMESQMIKAFYVIGKTATFTGNEEEPYATCGCTAVFDTRDMTLSIFGVRYRYYGFTFHHNENLILLAAEYWGDDRVLTLKLHTDYTGKQASTDPEWQALIEEILAPAGAREQSP